MQPKLFHGRHAPRDGDGEAKAVQGEHGGQARHTGHQICVIPQRQKGAGVNSSGTIREKLEEIKGKGRDHI